MIKTLSIRVKEKHSSYLDSAARKVNFVWNYVNQLSSRSIKEKGEFLSAYEVQKYTNGSSKELGLNSQTIQSIALQYVRSRNQFKKSTLSWRKSGGSRRSLGWIPIPKGNSSFRDGKIRYHGMLFDVWDSYGLDKYEFRYASFNEDARGRWYFNVCVEVPEGEVAGNDAIGIDLGLKDTATCSDGTVLESGRFYRDSEEKLAKAQRANKKKRVRNIHAKIKNRRKDALHKFSRELVNRSGEIYVGNVKSSSLNKTNMAKSVRDAGWYMLKTMLEYKCAHAGIVFKEVNESYTTVTCSVCNNRTGPTGLEGLRIREWTCECGVTHDRDINAARNILAVGHGRLVGGIAI